MLRLGGFKSFGLIRSLLVILAFLPACTGSGGGEIPDAFVVVGIEKEVRFFLASNVQPPGDNSEDFKFKVDQSNTVLDLTARFVQDAAGISSELWVLLSDRIRRYPTKDLTRTSTTLPAPSLDLALNITCEEGSYLRGGTGRMLIVCLQKDPSIPRLFTVPLTGNNLETNIDVGDLGTVTARNARYALGNDDSLLILQNRTGSPQFIVWPSRTNTNPIASKGLTGVDGGQLRDLIFENVGANTNNRALALIGNGNNTLLASWNLNSDSTPERGEKNALYNRLLVDTRLNPSRKVLFGTALAQTFAVQQFSDYTSLGALSLGAGVIGLDGFFYATSNTTDNNYLLTLDLQVPTSSVRNTDFRRINLNGKASGVAYIQVITTNP